jgi:hypothetical protein
MFANTMANWHWAASILNAFAKRHGMGDFVIGWLVGGWRKKVGEGIKEQNE